MNHKIKKPYVIIINGQPCTGKTYLLRSLSSNLNLTYISRDEIKELLFDELGIKDSEWSKKLGGASYSLFFKFLEKLLLSGNSFILEGNFNPKQHSQKFSDLFDKYGFNSIEIFLDADHDILFERFKIRWNSGERHRGHSDDERFEEFEIRLKENRGVALSINEHLIRIDTTNFINIDYKSLEK